MHRRATLMTLVALAGLASPALAQPVLQAQQGLTWDVPYPAGETVCYPSACCHGPETETWYRLEWTLSGVPFGGNAHDFDLLYEPWPFYTACTRAVNRVYPVKVYAIAPGTLVQLALRGVNAGGASATSNVLEVYWPWVCEATTAGEFRDCALECVATMGAAWCEGP